MKNRSDIVSSQMRGFRGFSSFRAYDFMNTNTTPIDISYLPFSHTNDLFVSRDAICASSRKESFVPKAGISRNRSFIDVLSSAVLSVLRSQSYKCDAEGCFPDSFYDACVQKVMAASPGDIDADLQTIYSKQMMMMLKKSGVVSVENGSVRLNEKALSYESLFRAFWEKVSWCDFFPSMPDTAERMNDERFLLIELLLGQHDVFCVDDMACEYFAGTHISKADMLLYVSFFDFSFFSWIHHFGFIEYVDDRDGRVKAVVTAWGRHFLSVIV